MPAPGQALRVEAGRPIERLGHRGPPVDHERLVVRSRHGEAADVERLTQSGAVGTVGRFVARLGEPVDAAEIEGLVANVELLQASEAGAHHDVTLGT